MDLNYSEEQLLLKESAVRFLQDKYSFERRRQIVATQAGWDKDVWQSFAELGWLALPFSEENGGLGGGPVEVSLLMEAMGRALVVEPYLASVILAGGLVERLGNADQKRDILEPLMAGTSRPALAHTERETGNDLARISTTARRDGADFVLSGEKSLVLGGPSAEIYLVSAKLTDTIRVFVVPASADGLTCNNVRLVDGARASDLMLSDVRVDADALLDGRPDTLDELENVYDRATAALTSDAVGAMEALLDATVAYTKGRVQFGKPLAGFQALQHRMAEMAVKCQEARASALLATLCVDAPRAMRMRGVSGAKAKIGRVSRHVAQEAIQMHGAMGFSEEMPVGAWFKRLFAFENQFGSTADHLARYGDIIRQPDVLAGSLLREPETA